MSEHFHLFGDVVMRRFTAMSREELHTVDATDLWESYLAAFPEGSNPVFRVRTEHDCSCCKNFVRNVGHVVQLTPEGYLTVWGGEGMSTLPEPYRTVAERMRDLVRQLPVTGVYRTKMPSYGAPYTLELAESGEARRWNHFSCTIASRHRAPDPEAERGRVGTNVGVYRRGLSEITESALETVLELIDQGTLYRGAEAKKSVTDFLADKQRWSVAPAPQRAYLEWSGVQKPHALLRNTAIGKLLQDLSEGVDQERALRSYETITAPANYRRPTAAISQKQIDAALVAIRAEGLEPSLQRRHASLREISVADVLWVDREARTVMRDPLADLMKGAAKPAEARVRTDATKLSIDDFLSTVAPFARGMSVILGPGHGSRFVSLTAPVDPEAPPIFKWVSPHAWSYVGDVTDSVRERVKAAGGKVDGWLRASLAWYNHDDLDIHVRYATEHIYFVDKRGRLTGGVLDVDMNAGGRMSRTPVENVTWAKQPPSGIYEVRVHNFSKRESIDVGFEVEVESPSGLTSMKCETALPGYKEVIVCNIEVESDGVVTVRPSKGMIVGSRTRDVWGVQVPGEVPVRAVMHSPNHWGESRVGQRHTIFALKGALNPDPVRGIYNEYLGSALSTHSKVLEVLGARTKAPYSDDQVSGVGFTTGRGDAVDVRVETAEGSNRVYTVSF